MRDAEQEKASDGRITVSWVDAARADGRGRTRLVLTVPVDTGVDTRAETLCRMCATRMDMSTTEKVVLGFLIDMEETGGRRLYSYRGLGEIIGRSARATEAAVASLRKAGLVSTARSGRGPDVTFSCAEFIAWARSLVSDRREDVPKTEVSVSKNPDPVPETADAVSKTRRRRAQALAAKKEYQTPAPSAPAAEQPAPAESEPVDELGMAPAYDGEFDNTAEVADTLRAAGRAAGEGSDDEDDISFGSETADTDMGRGVRINPNL